MAGSFFCTPWPRFSGHLFWVSDSGAVSFIRGSFCLINGKGWEIVKISKSTCRVKWAVLMSPHKAWVVQEAAWSSSVSSGFTPCLLMVTFQPSFFCENATCHVHVNRWTSLPTPGYLTVLLGPSNIAIAVSPREWWNMTSSNTQALPYLYAHYLEWRGRRGGHVKKGKSFSEALNHTEGQCLEPLKSSKAVSLTNCPCRKYKRVLN